MHLKELIHICAIVQRCLLHIQNQFLIIKQTYFQIINPVKIQSEKFSDQDHCRNLPLVLVDFMYFSCSHCVQDEQMLHSLQKTVRVECTCTLSFRDFRTVLKLKLAKIWNTDLQQNKYIFFIALFAVSIFPRLVVDPHVLIWYVN